MKNPKLYTKEDIDILSFYYLNQKMSTIDIEKKSLELFGQYISRGTIYKTLIKHNIAIRNKSESISIAMSTLDIDKKFENEYIIEWIDGLMLGDGFINFKKNKNYQNARYVIGTSSMEWAKYAMKPLLNYCPCDPVVYQKINKKHPNPIWESKTKTHPDIIIQAKRWYSGQNESKVIPNDIRITPISVMLWYLGDGSFSMHGSNSSHLRLSTCSFKREDIERYILPKLKNHKIDGYIDKYKGDIFINSHSIKYFFNFIGWHSPFKDYDHKFNIPEWLKLYRLSDITSDQKKKWRIQKWCKNGKVNYSKSPGGKMLLFTKKQVNQLRNILNENI